MNNDEFSVTNNEEITPASVRSIEVIKSFLILFAIELDRGTSVTRRR